MCRVSPPHKLESTSPSSSSCLLPSVSSVSEPAIKQEDVSDLIEDVRRKERNRRRREQRQRSSFRQRDRSPHPSGSFYRPEGRGDGDRYQPTDRPELDSYRPGDKYQLSDGDRFQSHRSSRRRSASPVPVNGMQVIQRRDLLPQDFTDATDVFGLSKSALEEAIRKLERELPGEHRALQSQVEETKSRRERIIRNIKRNEDQILDLQLEIRKDENNLESIERMEESNDEWSETYEARKDWLKLAKTRMKTLLG